MWIQPPYHFIKMTADAFFFLPSLWSQSRRRVWLSRAFFFLAGSPPLWCVLINTTLIVPWCYFEAWKWAFFSIVSPLDSFLLATSRPLQTKSALWLALAVSDENTPFLISFVERGGGGGGRRRGPGGRTERENTSDHLNWFIQKHVRRNLAYLGRWKGTCLNFSAVSCSCQLIYVADSWISLSKDHNYKAVRDSAPSSTYQDWDEETAKLITGTKTNHTV